MTSDKIQKIDPLVLEVAIFNILKRLTHVEFEDVGDAFVFTWHENAAEKAAQFCDFDF